MNLNADWLRQSPYPLHKLMRQYLPVSVIESCLNVDLSIISVKDDKGFTIMDRLLTSVGKVPEGIFQNVFEKDEDAKRVDTKTGKTLLQCL